MTFSPSRTFSTRNTYGRLANASKDCFGATPKPTRETRALPIQLREYPGRTSRNLPASPRSVTGWSCPLFSDLCPLTPTITTASVADADWAEALASL
jgi:hypothetical protein